MVEVRDDVKAEKHARADLERILIDRSQIAKRIAGLGAEISRDLEALPEDAEIMIVPVLTGSIIFVADLMRELPHKLRIGLLSACSYPGKATASTGTPAFGDFPDRLAGRFVLIVDDILDSGTTIRSVRSEIQKLGPLDVRTCVLLRKQLPAAIQTPCEYVGFDIADEFVVGYGLDYDGYYRNLPDIGVLKRTVM